MAAVLPATHLLRRFLLFALTVLFLLTMLRAGHALWHFTDVSAANALVPLFVQGLRFDLALVGTLLLPPVVVGSLLAMSAALRGVARILVAAWLMLSLAFVLLTEFLSPAYLIEAGARPTVDTLADPASPIAQVTSAFRSAPVPMALAAVLLLLVLIAFWKRLEVERLLGFALGKGSAIALCLFGALACVFAVWSGPVIGERALSRADADISDDAIVNELALNGGWVVLEPLLQQLPSP